MKAPSYIPMVVAILALLVIGCQDSTAPTTAATPSNPSVGLGKWGPETPPFNLEVILRDVNGGPGFGLVKFRQPNDFQRIVYLDTWVRNLAPNASYRLQRAVDANVNDDCTGQNWLTLGEGLVPREIVTDNWGTGRAELWRDLSAFPVGSRFDIHFRVIDAAGAVVLESECYQFVITQ
jgi:hypothetical protein